MDLKPGIYENISHSEYLALPYFSKSMVGPLLKSPKHLKHYQENDGKKSKRMDFGSVVDCLLLEPEREDDIFIIPETYCDAKGHSKPFNMRSNSCRQMVKNAEEKGHVCINNADFERSRSVVDAVKSHPMANSWLKGKYQVTIIWDDPQTGIRCKGRLDILGDDRAIDLKCTEQIEPDKFRRTATNLRYHVQAAMYLMGLHCIDKGDYPELGDWPFPFSFICAETVAPFDVVLYDMQVDSLMAGRHVFEYAVQIYVDCKLSNKWPGISNFAEPLEISQWALNKIAYEGEVV